MSGLLCLGRRTVTGLLSICGPQFRDWSASYRLFSQERFDQPAVFAGIRRAVLEKLPPGAPLCLAMDDSLLPKTGAKIHGVAWRRDPLGPAFQTNLIRAQRVLQISAGLPGATPVEGVRMVPVAFAHAPTPAKPRPHAPASQWAAYRQACRNSRLSVQARTQLQALHEWLRCEPLAQGRPVRLVVDGGYTNETVLKNLPAGVTLIGRIRKDAKLYYPPEAGRPRSTGRRLQYGQRAPTPEQLREHSAVDWETLAVAAAGETHQCRIKTIPGVLWRTAGANRLLRLVVIAALAYRPRKGGKLLYRQPAYLICTDPHLSVSELVQNYIWRWEIEVNFREEKTLIGVGQAQVRQAASTQAVPALLVAAYALLLLAAARCAESGSAPDVLPPPKWDTNKPPSRTSTQRMLHRLRSEIWGRGLDLHENSFSGFVTRQVATSKSEKLLPSLSSALLYCNA